MVGCGIKWSDRRWHGQQQAGGARHGGGEAAGPVLEQESLPMSHGLENLVYY